MKWKGNTLGHEVTHLVVDRFFGAGVPLWLNEGYAEYAAVAVLRGVSPGARIFARGRPRAAVPAGLFCRSRSSRR